MRYFILLHVIVIYLHALSMDEAIEIGLKNNPDYLMAQNKVLLSDEAKKAKQAINYGKASLVGSYTRYNIPRTLTPIVPPITSDIVTSKEISSLGVAYDVILFNGFSGTRDIDIALLDRDISSLTLQLSRDQLIYNIRSLYLKILTLESQKSAALAYQKALLKLHDIVDKGVTIGKKPKIDLIKLKADLEAANVGVKELESNINVLKATLASVIGIDEVIQIEEFMPNQEFALSDKEIETLTRYQLTEIQMQKSDKKLKNAQSTYYPNLTANGYYGNNYASHESDDLWQVGVGLHWVLFDFGARASTVQKAKIESLQTSLSRKKTALTLNKEIKEARENVNISVQKLQSAKAELAFAEESMKIENERYKQGVGTMYDLLFSYSRHQNTVAKRINAAYTLSNTIYYYKYITETEETK